MCRRNVKYDRFVAIRCVFQALNTPKLVSAGAVPRTEPRTPLGSLRRSLRPLIGWAGGHPFSMGRLDIWAPKAPRLPASRYLGAEGASLARPPTQIPGYAYDRAGAHNIA